MPKRITKTKFNKITEMLRNSGFTFVEIGQCCGVAPTVVSKIARGEHYYQMDKTEQRRRQGNPGITGSNKFRPGYLPTAEEISAACAAIRLTRKEEEKEAWTPPVVSASIFDAA